MVINILKKNNLTWVKLNMHEIGNRKLKIITIYKGFTNGIERRLIKKDGRILSSI